jgi:soluble lytic murein transglycosylase-like protein
MLWTLAMLIAACPLASAAEHVTLKNGFELDCVRREADGEHVRLYLSDKAGEAANYLEVAANSIVKIEILPAESNHPATPPVNKDSVFKNLPAVPTAAEMTEMLARAGEQHHIDADMLASVIHAESGGHVRAVSRTGAKGLMQLMPGTAAQLGVEDSFRADQNIAGGTAYLDQLLTRYHDNVALALAAYNAGPGAVDRWHGVPPYRETQEYVARVIREFNRRKQMLLTASAR